MKIINSYSFSEGENFIMRNHKSELSEIITAIENLEAISCLTKESKEKTMKGRLLFSPSEMNKRIKLFLHSRGWTKKSKSRKKPYQEPRHSFGSGRFREMDGIKNKVGLEIQFGKYAFMGYDIFSKMIIFKNLKYIDCGIEIVPSESLVGQMSTGVSSFDQLLIDLKNRGVSNIDIPVLVLGIGLSRKEKQECAELTKLFQSNKQDALKRIKLRKNRGSRPGPK